MGPPRNVEYCIRAEGHEGLHQWPPPDPSWLVIGASVRMLVALSRSLPAGAEGVIKRVYLGDDTMLYVKFGDSVVAFYSTELGMLLEVLPPNGGRS